MENLDLTKIIKVGDRVYSTILGDGTVDAILPESTYTIHVKFNNDMRGGFTAYGLLIENYGECVLFPSKEERNWSEYICNVSEKQHAGEICSDNRFEIIDRAKQDLIERTNTETSPQEMMWLDDFLFRCWQMGWLKKYDDVEKTNTAMKLNLFACKRDNGYCGGLIVVAAHDIDEAYNLYIEYGKKKCLVSFYDDEDEVFESYNCYPRPNWYQIPDITVECDSPRVIDEDGYTE